MSVGHDFLPAPEERHERLCAHVGVCVCVAPMHSLCELSQMSPMQFAISGS